MNISIYLGSSIHCDSKYNTLARNFGRILAENGHTIVYGGSNVGTMKDLADGALEAGGKVIGVFPRSFRGTRDIWSRGIEVQRSDVSEMIEVEDFAERKKVMEELGECSVTLPGSFGTLDELFTYACNRSIDKHSKPVYVLDYDGYYEPLKQLVANMAKAGFLKPHLNDMMIFCSSVEELMQHLCK
ncbi:MAG: TIGR00730 family Rossman fold protein [Bacteroidales bacterium]|nr:TIGR00730 family Rossman fold protein [Candidatus Cacconaster merdequi]